MTPETVKLIRYRVARAVVFDPAEVRAWRDDVESFLRAIAQKVEERVRADAGGAPG